MAKLKIALATCATTPNLSKDDQLYAHELRNLGTEVTTVIWDDPSAVWNEFDVAVIRSVWDYHKRPQEFRNWLDEIEKKNVRVWNPASLVRSNMNKEYLLELQAAEIPTIPTVFLKQQQNASLLHILEKNQWNKVVIKPVISASAFRTQLVERKSAEIHEAYFQGLLNDSGVMVQPFIEEVRNKGEWSFIYFDGAFSHSTIKRPASGDFRVQDDFGGSVEKAAASAQIMKQVETIAATIPKPWLYARIDGIELDGVFTLMELELIEPSLFLECDPGSAARFAQITLKKAIP